MVQVLKHSKSSTEIAAALRDFPALAEEAIQAAALPPLPCDYNPQSLECFFEDVSVLLKKGEVIVHQLSFELDYVPTVITLYGDEELLLVKAGHDILVNRLPENFIKAEWTCYGN